MQVALFLGVDKGLVLEDVQPLPPGPRDVVVETTASGVCHTDLSVLRGVMPAAPNTILGHEATGRVVEVGSAVSGLRPGDRVVASFVPACGRCWYCDHGSTHLCERTAPVSAIPRATRTDGTTCTAFAGLGSFSGTMTLPEDSVVKAETDLPDEQLALLGCGVTTGLGAVLNTAAVGPGSTVVVLGCGGVGQACVQGARIAGASAIIAVDPIDFKRDLAARLGATTVADPGADDLVSLVRELTGGRGADYVFEAIGRAETIHQAFKMVRRGGTVVTIGVPEVSTRLAIPAFPLMFDEKRVVGSFYGSAQVRRDIPRFIRFAESGQLELAALISRRIPLAEVGAALDAVADGGVLRSVIVH